MSHKFWSFNGDTYATHATAEDARHECLDALSSYASDASDDGWAEEVTSIMWGPIAERVVCTESVTVEELRASDDVDSHQTADRLESFGMDAYEDYDLVPVKA